MTRVWTVLFALVLSILSVSAQDASRPPLLSRRYVEGQQWTYLMKGVNNGKTYEVHMTGTVKKGDDGRSFDEYAWSDLDGKPLSPASQAFRARITLSGGVPFTLPDLSKTPQLVAPVLDLLTFYSDIFLAMQMPATALGHAGDHVRVPNPTTPASWADGSHIIIGEDQVDFDITLTSVDTLKGVATLLVKHVPPEAPKIRLLADWMRPPVADTPNNWVQVEKTTAGFTASVGKETFDVVLSVSLSDGRILSATMENPVTAIARECSDAALTRCGDAKPDPTLRRIEMHLLHE
jgi:hypothetical protein